MTHRFVPTSDPWLMSYNTTSASKLRLFCFSYAGGNAQAFQAWLTVLPHQLELIAINLPGRAALFDQKPYTDIAKLVPTLANKLMPWLNKPYAMFGHSLGAMLAFEATRYLRRFNLTLPQHLFLAGREGPQVPNKEQNYLLPDDQFCQVLREKEGTPDFILANEDLMALLLPTIRADFQMAETYQYLPEPPLNIPVTVFGGLQEDTTDAEFASWQKETSTAFKLHRLPGKHFFINTQYKTIIRTIMASLFQTSDSNNRNRSQILSRT